MCLAGWTIGSQRTDQTVFWCSHFRAESAMKAGSRNKRQEDLLPIRKMTEKFARCHEKDSEEDIAKRVFYLADDQIRVEFHNADNRITNSSRIFHKDGHSHIVQVVTILVSVSESSLWNSPCCCMTWRAFCSPYE